ncbi:MAG: hypothetical protein M1491_01860 [Deltaproteobacteria bacterium]|nr:hypothetical protein [Deltaproteobacteria bacterium]MCL5277200.1 hypothetical protein [Deltaproteobacteria bacterium]
MNNYYTMWFISILCVLIGQGCSKNSTPNQKVTTQASTISSNTVTTGSSEIGSPSATTITSGSNSNNEGITEAKIKNTLQTLNSIKWNKSMFDFSNPDNVKALDERNKMVSALMKDPSVLQRDEVKTTLIDLFNNQTKYAMEYVREHPDTGLGEGYGEEGPNLGGLMNQYMDKRSLYAEVVLLGNTHEFLTTYWQESSQLVLQRIADASSNKKVEEYDGNNILYQIAALGKAQREKHFTLDPEIIKSFKEFAYKELKSAHFSTRETAVEALHNITTKKDKEIIEALKTIAKTDPYKYGAPIFNEQLKKMELYPVREAA